MSSGRQQVLEALFPRADELEHSKPSCLRFDEEARRHSFAEHSEHGDQCVICLDSLRDSSRVSGTCGVHVFHYDCLMDWMLRNHDECPVCRRPLYDPETFQATAEKLGIILEDPTVDEGRGASEPTLNLDALHSKSLLLSAVILGAAAFMAIGVSLMTGRSHEVDVGTNIPIGRPECSLKEVPEHIDWISLSGHIFYPPRNASAPTLDEQALKFVMEDDIDITSKLNYQQIRQRFVLALLLFSENQHPNGLLPDNECELFWLQCNQDQRITKLITQNLPTNLGLLTTLTSLTIERNDVERTIPDSLGELVNLEDIIGEDANLVGSLPLSLQSWSNLRVARLDRNLLTGSLDPLNGWKSIEYLSIEKNGFTGSIPSGAFEHMTYFYAQLNGLNGRIPDVVDEWKSIQYFSVSANSLSGALPLSLSTWDTIETFHIDNNNITGGLPNISHWTYARQIHVDNNPMSGELPTVFPDSLESLSIFATDLTTQSPDFCTGQLKALVDCRQFVGCSCCLETTSTEACNVTNNRFGR